MLKGCSKMCRPRKAKNQLSTINTPRITGGISFSGIALPFTGCAQVRFLLACQPCNCYLLPINGLSFYRLPLEGKLSSTARLMRCLLYNLSVYTLPPHPSFATQNPPSPPTGEGFSTICIGIKDFIFQQTFTFHSTSEFVFCSSVNLY